MQKFSTLLNVTQSYVDETLSVTLHYPWLFSLFLPFSQTGGKAQKSKKDVFILLSVENFRAFTNKLIVGKWKYIMRAVTLMQPTESSD